MCTPACECAKAEFPCKEVPCKCYKDKGLTLYDWFQQQEPEKKDNRVACPACGRHADKQEPRYASMPHRDVVGYSYSKVKRLIGRIFYHNDGTICDQTLVKLEDLKKPMYLKRLGSKNDPRTH